MLQKIKISRDQKILNKHDVLRDTRGRRFQIRKKSHSRRNNNQIMALDVKYEEKN